MSNRQTREEKEALVRQVEVLHPLSAEEQEVVDALLDDASTIFVINDNGTISVNSVENVALAN